MYVHIGIKGADDEARLLETIRSALRGIDPSLPVLTLTTMREYRDENIFLWFIRLGAQLFTLLGVLALLLAMVGLYGIKALLISRRTREIGVRMALGATRGDVVRQMIHDSMRLTLIGLAAGLVLAFVVGQVLSGMLYQVSAMDPWAFLGATAFLAVGAAIASWLPVQKALRVRRAQHCDTSSGRAAPFQH